MELTKTVLGGRRILAIVVASAALLVLAGCSPMVVHRTAAAEDPGVESVEGLDLPADKVRSLGPNASTPDCGSFWLSSHTSQQVMYVNMVKTAAGQVAQLNLSVVGVDCYDWGSQQQPEVFNNAVLNAKDRAVSTWLDVRETSEYGGSTRPWETTVCTDMDNFPGVGWQQLCGDISPRSAFEWTPVYCSYALCDGISLCADDTAEPTITHPSKYSRLESTMDLVGTVDGVSHGTLTVTTLCTPLEHSSKIVLSGRLE